MFRDVIEINRRFAIYVRTRFGKKVHVTDQQVQAYKNKLHNQYSGVLYDLDEIVVEGDNALEIAKTINPNTGYKGGAMSSFRSLGWVSASQLGSLKKSLDATSVGHIAVIPVNSRCCRVILVKNKKIPGKIDPLDVFVKLYQVVLPKEHPYINDIKITFDDLVGGAKSWKAFEEKAKLYTLQTVDTPLIPFKAINPSMQQQLKPVLTSKKGAHCVDNDTHYLYVVVMEKKVPEGFKMPNDSEIKHTLEQQEYQKFADREIRQLSRLFYKKDSDNRVGPHV